MDGDNGHCCDPSRVQTFHSSDCIGMGRTCRRAVVPTRRSLSFVKATTDGVVRDPSAFSMTLACEPSMTATQLLVVPKSIPMTWPVMLDLSDLQAKSKRIKNQVHEEPSSFYT